MKVYVDELPKSCERCPFHDTKYGICDISGLRVEYFGCHSLTPLSDHDQEVRKKVCEEIKNTLRKQYPTVYANIGESLFCSDCYLRIRELTEILDQMQGGSDD